MKKLSSFVKKIKKDKIEVCPYYFQNFSTHKKLDKHKIDCINHTAVRVEFTDKKK